MTRAPRRRRSRRVHTAAISLCSLLLGALTAGMAGQLPPAQGATTAPLALTTLFSTIEGQPTVSGINALPVGPTDIGTFRQAMAFTPTTSGQAQLLSMRGQCVGLACQEIGQVSIQADVNGKPSGTNLGSMGFYLVEEVPNLWRISLTGNPTGGTFRLRYTDGATVKTTEPIPWNAWITCWCLYDPPAEDVASMMSEAGFPLAAFGTEGDDQLPADLVRMSLAGAGTVTAVDVHLTGGTAPTVNIEQPRVDKECGSISGAPMLTAGTKYWAVMSAPGEVAWNYWSNDPSPVLESIDAGPWVARAGAKTPALRIDSGATTCQPVAEPNPAPGTKIADLVTAPGASAFTTVTMGNGGVAPLTLGRARFTGTGASVFSLLNQQPGVLAGPFKIPTSIGVDGLSILYVACNSAQQGYFASNLVIDTSDPDLPSITYPVTCLVDNTPPTVAFASPPPTGVDGWYRTSPVTLGVTANDPESGHRLSSMVCQDDNLGGMNPSSASGRNMTSVVSGQGIHNITCEATDLAGNHASGFTREIKVDSSTPQINTTVTPSANNLGWHRTDVTVAFVCTDAEPGSGLAEEVGGGTTVTQETAGTQVAPTGCRDRAGNQAMASAVTVKLDRTPPSFAAVVSPTPNVAGWNNSKPVAISFPCADAGPVQSGVVAGPLPATLDAETSAEVYTRDASACVDRAGNPAAQGVTSTVRIDVTAPTTTIADTPSGFTPSDTAVLTVAGSDDRSGVARFECSLDAAAYVACPNVTTYEDLAQGPHSVRVRSVDVAGNVDASPAESAWTVDYSEPSTEITERPSALTNQDEAAFAYTGSDAGSSVAGFECRIDGAPFEACAADGADYDGLAQGAHTFDVRARDAAGNRDGDPAHWAWTVDLTAPTTTITTAPPRRTPSRTATFELAASDTGGGEVAGLECRVDGDAFAACASPVTLPGLELGEHTFEVRAIDTAGNVEAPVTRTWSVLEFFVEDDGAATNEGVAVTVPVAVNDVAPSGSKVALHPSSSAAGGTVVVQGDALLYTPPADFHGTDTFTYTAENGAVTSDPATVTVQVLPVNDAPRFVPGGSIAVAEDSGAYAAGWATAVGPGPQEGGQAVHFVLDGLSDPALFAVPPSLGPDGVLRFTSAPQAAGTATVRARLVDDGGTADGGQDTSDPVVLRIDVSAVDDAPRIEVLPSLRARGDRVWLRVRVTDLDSSALTVKGQASADGLAVTPSGAGEVRKIRLRGLVGGTHGRLVLRVSDASSEVSTSLALRVGSRAPDTLTGTGGADLIVARGGDDRAKGFGGDDLVAGGGGDDRLVGGRGDDVLRGGPGDDVLLGGPGSNTVLENRFARG